MAVNGGSAHINRATDVIDAGCRIAPFMKELYRRLEYQRPAVGGSTVRFVGRRWRFFCFSDSSLTHC